MCIRDSLRPLLYLLAGHCYKAGIPEEEAVRQVMMHYYREADEQLVRMTLHNLYRECKGFVAMPGKQVEQGA